MTKRKRTHLSCNSQGAKTSICELINDGMCLLACIVSKVAEFNDLKINDAIELNKESRLKGKKNDHL